MMKLQPLRMACRSMAAFVAFVVITYSSYAQTPADDLAAQVRSQGYGCDQPIAATRDARLSKRDSAVWILRCRDSAYRVRLDPDMAARITKLRKKSHRP
jgi:hypothetical protein